jgi:hypothetical protein
MLENEFLRRKRELRFQDQVLSGIAKKSSRLVALINSPLFIWFLTAVLLTAGGAYFTRIHQCVIEGEQVIEKRQRLSLEMDNRRRAIARIIAGAKTLDDVRSGLQHLPSTYADFKERSLLDISSDFLKLNQSIDETRVTSLENALSRHIEPITRRQFLLYNSVFIGQLDSDSFDLDDLKDFTRKYFEGDRIRSLVHRMSSFRPNCVFQTIVTDFATSTHSKHVLQEPIVTKEWIDSVSKDPNFYSLEVFQVPGLRAPFVKLAPQPEQINSNPGK